ncbi:MAG: type II secretion system F family protein [Halothiobacillaceae bacterium]
MSNQFAYVAANRAGSLERGQLEARSRDEAVTVLRQRGLRPVRVERVEGGHETASGGRRAHRVPAQAVLSFTAELAVLLRAGMPIDRSLKLMTSRRSRNALSDVLAGVLEDIKSGRTFSDSLGQYPSVFGPFYISLVRAGEASGGLAEALGELATYLQRIQGVRSSITSAMVYPAILLVIALLSLVLMLGFVVPQFEELFRDLGEGLPLSTQVVMDLGDWVAQNWWALPLAIIVLAVGGQRIIRSRSGRSVADRALLSLPVVGTVFFRYQLARFLRTFGTLLKSGVPMLDAVRIASDTVENVEVARMLEGLSGGIKSGRRVSHVLEQEARMPDVVIHMIGVGEESGRLDQMLLELSEMLDQQVQQGVKRALTLLEPVLILVLGGLIALIIISILLGVLSVNDLVA